ncbi:hypothetical protein [Yoonia sp.]|uniref:hypothetical protein n=1 Tax=Yoonia sp. TaxID=2212373 RepID=UPI00391BA9EE
MTHSLYLTPTLFVALPYPTDGHRTAEHALPPIQPAPDIPPLPPQRPYLAQAIAAQLQGGDFVRKFGEILPDDRVLRPYGTPMLPAEKTDDTHDTPKPSGD